MPVPVALPQVQAIAARPVALRRSAVAVNGRLRVADLIAAQDARTLPLRTAALIVVRLPLARRQPMLRSEDAVALLRRRVPGLALAAPEFPTIPVTMRISAPATVSKCYATARPLEAGEALAVRDLAPTECRPEAGAGLRRDTAGTIVARDPLAAGSYLGRVAPVAGAPVTRGAALTLRAVAGPAAIERRVTALQSGRSGHPLFVRAGDGAVFAVPLQVEEAAR